MVTYPDSFKVRRDYNDKGEVVSSLDVYCHPFGEANSDKKLKGLLPILFNGGPVVLELNNEDHKSTMTYRKVEDNLKESIGIIPQTSFSREIVYKLIKES